MIHVIMSYGVHRNQAGRNWPSKAIVYVVASLVSGVSIGALLGAVGGSLPDETRLAFMTAAGVAACAIGLFDALVRRVRVPELSRETSHQWMEYGAWRGAAMNGAALGAGFTTRIGFWLWYAVPIGAFLSGALWLGAILYGVYAVVRGGSVWLLIAVSALARRRYGLDFDEIAEAIMARRRSVRLVASMQLALLGVISLTAVSI